MTAKNVCSNFGGKWSCAPLLDLAYTLRCSLKAENSAVSLNQAVLIYFQDISLLLKEYVRLCLIFPLHPSIMIGKGSSV